MAVNQLYREVLIFLLSSPSDTLTCQQDVRDLFHRLGRRRCQKYALNNADHLREDLENCQRLFEVRGRGYVNFVAPKTSLTICRIHSNKGGSCPDGTCLDLHFCAFFLLSGQCGFGERCHFGHELRTQHNQYLLERHLLSGLPITDLRTLFCLPAVRQGVTLPQVCRFYNKNRGCTRGVDCHSLHLCRFYVMDECRFGRGCDRNHNIDDNQVMKVLTLYGVKVKRNLSDVLQEVRIYNRKLEDELDMDGQELLRRPTLGGGGARSKRYNSTPNLFRGQQLTMSPEHAGSTERASKRPRNTSESACSTKTEDICLFNLKGTCQFGENCRQLHSPVPYLWQLSPADEHDGQDGVSGWKSLPSNSNMKLEKAYSQPQETGCIVTDENGEEIKVDFRNMSAENSRTREPYMARRVSTLSAVDGFWKGPGAKRHHVSLATVWLWYWRNQHNVWLEFGMVENGSKLSVSSTDLEKQYLENGENGGTLFQFDHFVLDFGKKRLKNIHDNCKFKVRRRPKLVLRNDDAETDTKEKYWSDSDVSDKEGGIPSNDGDDADDEDGKDSEARASHTVALRKEDDDARTNHVSAAAVLSPIHGSSQRFMTVKGRFSGTLGVACTVIAICQVDSPRLEDRFKKARQSMKKQQSRKNRGVEKMMLYYGPSPDEDIAAIYTSGVDCSGPMDTTSRNGTAPAGKGGYFHVNASRANKDVVGNEGKERYMFVMKCLVGHRVLSMEGAQPPAPHPPRNRPGKGYGCWVDDVEDPKTFVFTKPSQVCPAYLITYQVS